MLRLRLCLFLALLTPLLGAPLLGAPLLGAPLRAGDGPAVATFTVDGVKLRYFTEGQGEPIVLIHGLNASAELNWKLPGIVATLAKKHQVIALDLPGHGGSDKPESDEAYGVQMAEDVRALLEHLKIKKAHVVGYSLGGMVALKLAVLHPDCVRSVVLGGMGWLKADGAVQQVWERAASREGGRAPKACIRGISKLAITENELKAVRVPVTVIVGDRDPVKRLYVEPLRAARNDWPVIEIEGAGHINCIIKKQFTEELQKALARHAAPS
jgi:pimeloyl-ACP methyl ester carboxylesterase